MSDAAVPATAASPVATDQAKPASPVQAVRWNDPRALVSFYALTLLAAALTVAFMLKDAATTQLVIGSIVSMAGVVVSFWMGSSHSSQNKDAVIAAKSMSAPPS